MKHIALATVCLGAAVGTGYGMYPDEVTTYVGAAGQAAARVWEGIEANPVPLLLAVGTFLLTVLYHTAKGKSLGESVEVAATRVRLVPLPPKDGGEAEPAVLRRAKARATRAQLVVDQIGLENRHRKLPEAIVKAEKEACYTEQAVTDAARVLADRRKAHDEAVAKLDGLRKEKAAADAELAEIGAELTKLADVG